MSVTVTERAEEEIKRVKKEQNLPEETPLRLGVKGGGCSGFSYFMGFDGSQRPDDQVLEFNGLKVLIDSKSLGYISGIEVDFNEDMLNRGFVFKNPNAKGSCGCGHSFSV